jgi:hypothetical protein
VCQETARASTVHGNLVRLLHTTIRWLSETSAPCTSMKTDCSEIFAWETGPGDTLASAQLRHPERLRDGVKVRTFERLRAQSMIPFRSDGGGMALHRPGCGRQRGRRHYCSLHPTAWFGPRSINLIDPY